MSNADATVVRFEIPETPHIPEMQVSETGAGAGTGARTRALSARETIAAERREFEIAKGRRLLEREGKRAEPIDPLRKSALYSTLALALLILTASAIFSFAAIMSVAEWMFPSWPWLVVLVPIATEFFIVFFGMDSLISQARGDERGARFAFWGMAVASGVAVIANVAHTVAGASLDPSSVLWQTAVGVLLSALIPIGTLLAAKRAIRLVFERPAEAPAPESES